MPIPMMPTMYPPVALSLSGFVLAVVLVLGAYGLGGGDDCASKPFLAFLIDLVSV